MKRKLLLLILCVCLGKIAIAQKDSLAFDDRGKYIYYKVVNVANNNADALFGKALVFFKSAFDKNTLKLTSQDGKAASLTGEGYFLVSKKLSMAKHDDGKITCKVTIEIKDSKYRYWLTDFVFTPYQRDRYNNMVPQLGLDVDMEKANKQYDKADVEHYLDECGAFSKRVGKKLEQFMVEAPKAKKDTVAKKVISINKW